MPSNGNTSDITVNIMSYNYGHLAAQAIESVIYQSRPPEVIRFYDDGAGDCTHLPEIYPEVEFILRKENMGIIDNFNDALDRTKTERVMFLGADNWLDPLCLELISKRGEDIVSYDAYKVKEGVNEWWRLKDQPHGSALYNVEKAKEFMYSASGNKHTEEDSVLFSKMRKAGASYFQLDAPLLYYRWRHRRNFNQ